MNTVIITILQLVGGFIALTVGATWFVDGASGIAERFKVPPLIIGLTIVALGTSAPEIAVNVVAAYSDQSGLAVGNVVGSNVLNILCVLGICALVAPLIVSHNVVRRDVPVMVFASLLLWMFARDQVINSEEASILLVLLFLYTIIQIIVARMEIGSDEAPKKTHMHKGGPIVRKTSKMSSMPLSQIGMIVIGALALLLGSQWLVAGATTIAKEYFGISDLVVGLTVVAIGTSLPELAASLTATLKGERELAVGNVVGSNIYNVLAVIGFTGIIARSGIGVPQEAISIDFPVMIAASIACLPIFFFGWNIARWEGALFLAYYVVYISYLVLASSQHAYATQVPLFLKVAIPVSLLLATILWWLEHRAEKNNAQTA